MLILFTMIFLFMAVTKTPVIRNIKAALIILAFLIVSEMINLGILQFLYGSEHVKEIMDDNVQKTLYSIPSTIIFVLLAIFTYYLRVIRKREKVGKDCTPAG